MLEKFLTVPKTEFETYLIGSKQKPVEDPRREAYRYSKVRNFGLPVEYAC